MNDKLQPDQVKRCSATFILAVNDAVNVVNGKWKLPIIGSLLFGKKRFKELAREIPRITSRMLSKELKDLEVNGMITRKVYDTTPVMVEYQLTQSGESFRNVLDAMIDWGLGHRTISIGKKQKIAETAEQDKE